MSNKTYLINRYRKLLDSHLSKEQINHSNLLSVGNFIVDSYYKEMYDSLIKHLETNPVYESRQAFIDSIYLDENENIYFHLKDDYSSSTCAAGKDENDPFYNRNWCITNYKVNNNKYSRITYNLKSRFFSGTYNKWKYYKNKNNYILSLSLEDISIEEFNKLFAANRDFNSTDFKNELSLFLKKIFYKTIVFDDEPMKTENIDLFLSELSHRNNSIFLDENLDYITESVGNYDHYSLLSIGDLLVFDSGWKIVDKIEIHYNKDIGNYSKIFFKKYKGEKPTFY